MDLDRRQFLLATGGTLAAGALPGLAQAQNLETARIVVGFPPGGTTDAVARRMADKLRGNYAKVVLVDNKPGAGGRIGVDELRRNPPDGSTLLLTPASIITLYPHIFTKLPYTTDDVSPVSTACIISFAFGVGPAVPASVKNLKDYFAWVKANPAQAGYATPGAGTPPHFLGMLLSKESGVELNHVPYRGSAPGIQDLVGGQIPAMSSPIGDYLPHLASGKLRVLATSGPKRSRFTPDVPTYAEQGFPALQIQEWYGFFLPGKASPEAVTRAADAIRAAVAQPDVAEAFSQLGFEASAITPADMAKAVKAESAAWGPLVKRVGFTPEA
ncbi:twin-arginine translocation pathway signal protein [Ideonella azotifigens]|uniref:Tripartite tricarboxylate transporter substrate binding protein n=1 Tax=Ideonella azotifigens TaxID=513160 RepID=A0ABP3UW28_9BURK|nr:Bug family tripartite tricarboxylate transporter substrate binding protein [Ideonella azotifigens]MCD2341897.1 twin-arginine translocation pathway signal protein [Ideonella azotifigens]